MTLLHRSSRSNTQSLNSHSSARLGILMLGVLLIFFGVVTAVQGEVVISEDFNTGTAGEWPDGWYVDNGVWEHGVPAVGPANCAGGDDSLVDDFCTGTVLNDKYPDVTESHLVSTVYELPPVSGNEELQLRFFHWFGYNVDAYGQIDISIKDPDSGTWSEWKQISNIYGKRTSNVWSRAMVDLSAYAGDTVRLGFFHVADALNEWGWYIDAVEIWQGIPEFTGDFEGGWVDWSASNGIWEVGTPTAAGSPEGCYLSSQCAGTMLNDRYPDYTDSRLVSATLQLPDVNGDEELQLRYFHWFGYNVDANGQVDISVKDPDTGVWSDWTKISNIYGKRTSYVWSRAMVDLTAYAGDTVRLGFFHVADALNEWGWYIDAVEIWQGIPEFTGDFEGGWVDWSASNGIWEVGTPTAAGSPEGCYLSSQCAGTALNDRYPDYTDSILVGATITLPDESAELYVNFYHWFSYASGNYGEVIVSVLDELTGVWSDWIKIGEAYGPGSSSVWTFTSVDLTTYSGNTVRLGFSHVADTLNDWGWYIDGIEVSEHPWIDPRPPILDSIGDQNIEAGDLLAFTVTATDPDGDALALTSSNLPAGATFVDNGDGTGLFNWQTTAEDEGTYGPVTFKVTDSGVPILSDYEEITITVGDVNQPPVLAPIGDQSLEAGELFTLNLTATDPDEDELTFKATDLPTGAIFTDNGDDNDTAQFSWTPDEDLAGNFIVTFIVTDDGSPELSDSEEVTLTVGDVNRPPILDPIGNQVIGSGEEVTLLLTATDPDGDDLTYEASGIPTGASFIDNKDGTAEFIWTPDEELTGNFWMTFKVTDDGEPAESDSESLHISVGHMNRPPVMGPVGNHGITPGEPFHYALHASDPEGDALRFIVAGLPEDAEFDDNEDGSADFNWKNPTEDDARNYKLLFRVIDTAEPMASDWEEATFTVGDVNRPPMLAPIGNRTADLDEEINLVLTCRDPDGNKCSYQASDLPEGASWTDNQNGTALFTWEPVMDQAGNHTITFTVTDSEDESDSETIVISVGEVNRPPVLNPIGDRTVDEEEPIWIPVIAGDPDGDLIDLSVLDMPEDAYWIDYGDGTGDFEWTAQLEAEEPEGDETRVISFMATDLGLPPVSASDDVSITVRGECELPEEPEDLKVKATKKKVTLTWEYEDEADYFIIYRSVDNEDQVEIATTTDTSYIDRKLPTDFDRIEYYVSAVNACGESELAGPVTVRPKGP